jgi:hypothetical protein
MHHPMMSPGRERPVRGFIHMRSMMLRESRDEVSMKLRRH